MKELNFQNDEKLQLKVVLKTGSEMVLTILEPGVNDTGKFDKELVEIDERREKAIKTAKDRKEKSEAIIISSYEIIEHMTKGFIREEFQKANEPTENLNRIVNALNKMRTEKSLRDSEEKKTE